MVKYLILISSLIFFSGCSTVKYNIPNKGDIKIFTTESTLNIVNSESGYVLSVPSTMFAYGSKKFFSTIAPPKPNEFPNYDQQLGLNDYDLRILDFAEKGCPPLGIRNPLLKTDELGVKTTFGKVDDYEQYTEDPFAPRIYCSPWKPITSSYVLCSEYDNKTALVCINQVQDNPAIAEEIFSTFHWTK